MKYRLLKFIFAAVFAAAVISASGCGKEPVARDPNIPDNTVAPLTQAAADTAPYEAPADGTDAPTEAATTAEELPVSETSSGEYAPEQVEDSLDTRAMEYLKLLNSDSVHAVYLEISSIDGENMFSTQWEYFINGSEKIYISDDYKALIKDGTVTYVDLEAKIFYSFPAEEAGDSSEPEFGYDMSLYRLISSSEEDGVLTEEYSVEGLGLTSTWKFESDGTVKVSDRFDGGSFTLYTFDTIESAFGSPDFPIPEGFTEVDAEEYMNY